MSQITSHSTLSVTIQTTTYTYYSNCGNLVDDKNGRACYSTLDNVLERDSPLNRAHATSREGIFGRVIHKYTVLP